jgi:hypothetical protein
LKTPAPVMYVVMRDIVGAFVAGARPGTTVNVVVALPASFAGGRFKSRLGDAAALRWLTVGALIRSRVRLALLERR